KERGNEAPALRLLAEIAALQDPPNLDGAAARYGEALALAAELGMRPLVAHCHLGLAKLSWHTHKREQAQEHLTATTAVPRHGHDVLAGEGGGGNDGLGR